MSVIGSILLLKCNAKSGTSSQNVLRNVFSLLLEWFTFVHGTTPGQHRILQSQRICKRIVGRQVGKACPLGRTSHNNPRSSSIWTFSLLCCPKCVVCRAERPGWCWRMTGTSVGSGCPQEARFWLLFEQPSPLIQTCSKLLIFSVCAIMWKILELTNIVYLIPSVCFL